MHTNSKLRCEEYRFIYQSYVGYNKLKHHHYPPVSGEIPINRIGKYINS